MGIMLIDSVPPPIATSAAGRNGIDR